MKTHMIVATFILLIAQPANLSAISLVASVDNPEIKYEERITLLLEITIENDSISTNPLLPLQLTGFSIAGTGSSIERRDGLVIRKFTYLLAPNRSGTITIPALQVEFTDSVSIDTLSSKPIIVTVAEPTVEQRGRLHFAAITAFGIIVALIVIVAIKRRQKNRNNPITDWREPYRQQFTDIRRLAMQQRYRQFSEEIIRLITKLLERKYEISLAGMTTADVIETIGQSDPQSPLSGRLQELFGFCEQAKYSVSTIDINRGSKAAEAAEKIVELLLY